MYHAQTEHQHRPHAAPSIASVSTIRADPFIDQRTGELYGGPNAIGLFQNSAPGPQIPPVPPARSSSLVASQDNMVASTSTSPKSPLTTRVPSVQVIHPTPTKKKGRPRSTASGDTAVGGSPSRRPLSRLASSDQLAVAPLSARDEAKKARAREKGRERQRRKRERDKAAKEESKPSKSSISLTPSHSMSVPSSVSSTYSSLPHSQSMYSISTSPNASLVVSTSSTSLSGTSSPSNMFSPAIPGEFIWTGKSRRSSRVASRTHLTPGSPPPKRRKSEPEPDAFRSGLGVTLSHQPDGPAPLRRPQPRRTTSLALTEASTAPSAPESDTSEWGARSPTPPPVPLPHLEDLVSSQGQFFASTMIHACEVSGLAEVLQRQLKLGKAELDGLRNEIGIVYDKWAKGVLEQGMGKVTIAENAETTEASTPQRPRAETHSGPPGSPLVAHSRTRSLSSASMLARGLVLNPVPAPPSHTTTINKWDSPKAHGPGSDSPTHSNLQTPSTGQGTSFTIPNHDPVPNMPMIQGQNHWRSHTDPRPGYDYRMDGWRPVSGGLESPLAMTKGGRPPTASNGHATSQPITQTSTHTSNSTVTPPHARQHSAPVPPTTNSANSTPLANPLPHLNQPRYAYTQMSNQVHQRLPPPHPYPYYGPAISQPTFTPTSNPYPTVPWTPTAVSHPGSFRQAPMAQHPFTPQTPMPLKGAGEAPLHYMPSFVSQFPAGTPPVMMPMGALLNGMGEPLPALQQTLSHHTGSATNSVNENGNNGHPTEGEESGDRMVMS